MKEDLLFYDAYEEFYKMASTSETFRNFCIDAYGADFSQDGFSDVKQIDMIVPFIMNSDAHVLDIGCGNGKMIKYLGDKTGAHIHGFDYSDNAIMHAKTNNDSGDFRVGVIGKIEYSKESFDVIVAMDMAVQAMSFDGVSADKKEKIEKKTTMLARKLSKTATPSVGIKTRFMFWMMGMMQKKGWNSSPIETEYWKEKGWLDGKKPWK